MKSVSKWSLCFRPPSTIEIDDGVDCSADRMFSLIAAARSSNRLNKKKKKKLSKSNTLDSSDPSPTTSRRSFASVVRAVVFETSLSRKVREAKLRNRSTRSVKEPVSDQKSAVAVFSKSDSNQTENSTSPQPESAPEDAKQSEIVAKSAGKINPVVCLILLSLLMTVFYGRLCAVMTTTVWIYAWQTGMLKLRKKNKEAAMEEEVKLNREPTISVQKETN